MGEFFGDLERFAADLYPWRYLIGAAVLVVVGAILASGYLRGWHLWLWRHRIPSAMLGGPALVLVAALAYYLGSPLFTDDVVEEELPFAFSATGASLSTPTPSAGPTEPPSATPSLAPELTATGAPSAIEAPAAEPTTSPPAPLSVVSTQATTLTPNPVQAQPSGPTSTPIPAPTPAPEATPMAAPTQAPTATPMPAPTSEPTATPAPAGPVLVKSGSFRDQDNFHKGSGQAIIYLGPDGSHLLRLEDLDVTNGPDLYVYLSPHPDPMNNSELDASSSASSKATKGTRTTLSQATLTCLSTTAWSSTAGPSM